jgi:ribonuclease J
VPHGGFVTLDEAISGPPGRATILISGSQGEANSALARVSDGQFKQLKVEPGDGIVLSSRIIPGNERSVQALLNRLAKRGASIHYGLRAQVHVSGHAYREELRSLIQLVRPKYFVPVHGEFRHLEEHRKLAAETGLPLDHCVLLEDGDVLELDDGGLRTGERVIAGRVLVDGTGEGDIGLEVLRERRHLSEDGFVVAVLAIHQQTGEVTSGPELISRGVVREGESQEFLDDAKTAVLDKLREIPPESRADLLEVENEVRRVLKKYFAKTRDRYPLIVPHIFEM